MEQQTENAGFVFAVDFLKRQWKRTLITAVVSFCVAALVFLVFLLLPANRNFSQDIQVMLEPRKNETGLAYPSKKPFNKLDIISPVVLKEVYRKNKLEPFLPFDEFQEMFSVSDYSPKRAFLDSAFGQKLSKRNLSVVDIERLEADYRRQLASLDQGMYRINLGQNHRIPPETAAKILNEIPQTWMEIFRSQEGEKLPQVDLESNMEKKLRSELQNSRLLAIDQAGVYNEQMLELCDKLIPLLQERNLALPSGEYLPDLMKKLRNIKTYQLNVLLEMVIGAKELRNNLDLLFLQSQIQQLEREQNLARLKYQNIDQALSILQDKNPTTRTGRQISTETNAQLNFDAGIFDQITELVRRDSGNTMRRNLADLSLELGEEMANTESKLQYYKQLLASMSEKSTTNGSTEAQFNRLFDAMLANLADLSNKVQSFKQMLTKEYLSGLNFYVPVGQTVMRTDRLISIPKLGGLLLGIWVVFNVLMLAAAAGKEWLKREPTA